jgi:hypothetical protein
MRAWIVILVLLATPALAAPTCLTPKGDTIRCGAPGAMPVLWKPSPQVMWEREMEIKPPGPSTREVLAVFGGLALFLALIALLPDFDGWQDGDDKRKRK